MAENSKIEWCHHTANYWIGCTKIQSGGKPSACDFCYAERDWDHRFHRVEWGPHGERSPTKHDALTSKMRNWNQAARKAGEHHRVFVNSLSDWADNHKSIDPAWRSRIFEHARMFPNLRLLLLTKRPQNIKKYLPDDWGDGYPNVWLGTTVENQEEADRRIPHLMMVPAKVWFLSCEPLLGGVDLSKHFLNPQGLTETQKWVIAGGESGANYRQTPIDYFRSLRDQCDATDAQFLFKQYGGKNQKIIKAMGRELDGVVHDGYPEQEQS